MRGPEANRKRRRDRTSQVRKIPGPHGSSLLVRGVLEKSQSLCVGVFEGNLDEIKAAAEAVKNQTKVAAPAGSGWKLRP